MNSRMNGVNEKGVETEARYSLEEELQIIKSIQQGGKERDTAIEKLAQSRLRFLTGFVTAVAKRYANNNLSMDELIEAGNKGLVLAAENLMKVAVLNSSPMLFGGSDRVLKRKLKN